jgi:hypothetical protein
MTLSRFAPVLGLALAVTGAPLPTPRAVAAQEQNICTLLTHDDVQTLVPDEHVHVSDGVPGAAESMNTQSCRYTWGEGTGRYSLAVNINPASRMFVGGNADAIKLALLASVRAETADATISDVGDAAVFKAYSTIYVSATAYLKERILQVNLDGFDAVNKRDALISLLKKAAAKL